MERAQVRPCAPGNIFSLLLVNGGLAGTDLSLRQENRFHSHLVFNPPSHHVYDFVKKHLVSLTEG